MMSSFLSFTCGTCNTGNTRKEDLPCGGCRKSAARTPCSAPSSTRRTSAATTTARRWGAITTLAAVAAIALSTFTPTAAAAFPSGPALKKLFTKADLDRTTELHSAAVASPLLKEEDTKGADIKSGDGRGFKSVAARYLRELQEAPAGVFDIEEALAAADPHHDDHEGEEEGHMSSLELLLKGDTHEEEGQHDEDLHGTFTLYMLFLR